MYSGLKVSDMASCLLPFLGYVFPVAITLCFLRGFAFIGLHACCLFCHKYSHQYLLLIILRYSWTLPSQSRPQHENLALVHSAKSDMYL